MDLSISNLLTTYELPAIFLGAFFFGETVVLTAAFLAGEGTWSINTVFWLSLLGTVISDSLWFYFGYSLFKFTKRWEKYHDKYTSFLIKLEEWTKGKLFLSLLFIKFLYGTRILTIIYLSIRKVPFSTFFIFNTAGAAIWLLVMLPAGWFIGMGAADTNHPLSGLQYALTALVLLVIFYKLFTSWLSKKITKE